LLDSSNSHQVGDPIPELPRAGVKPPEMRN